MNEEKWQQLKEGIGLQFKIIDEEKEPVFYDNPITQKREEVGNQESVTFLNKEGDEQKIERILKKVIIDKKMHYHKTKSDAITESIFSPSEYSDTVKFYRKINDEWIEAQD